MKSPAYVFDGDMIVVRYMIHNRRRGQRLSKSLDLTNQHFGKLTVIGRGEDYVSPSGVHLLRWKCKCECGNDIVVGYSALIKNPTISCGCKNKKSTPRTHIKPRNVVGTKIGMVDIIEEKEPHITPNGSKQRIVIGKCSCGNIFETRLAALQKTGRCRKCAGKAHRLDVAGQRFGQLIVMSERKIMFPLRGAS